MLNYLNTNSNVLSETIFQDKFTDKKILVIGSGPSVNLVNWESLDVDGIVTTSFFYLNDKIRNLNNITHITLTDLVELNHPNLITFLDNNPKCTIAFEPKDHPFYNTDDYHTFTTTYKDRIIYYTTRYGKKEGVAGRVCYFVGMFQPESLYYVGIDGKSHNPHNDPTNAFRSNIRGDADGYPQTEFIESHLYFADNLYNLSIQNGTKIFNLGEGFEFNCSTPYSKEHFPLNEETKKIIKL